MDHLGKTPWSFSSVLKHSKYLFLLVPGFIFSGFIGVVKFPLLYKYAETLVVVDYRELERSVELSPIMLEVDVLKLNQLAFQIPFVSGNKQINAVSFENKFRRSVVEGDGNCSNHVGSVSWYLLTELDVDDFAIVHFLPKQLLIEGFGHSVLYAGGIYDIFEGGVWVNFDGSILTLRDIDSSSPSDRQNFEMKILNSYRENKTKNYVAEILDSNFIGVTPAKSYSEYITFIDSIYVPFRNKKVEKYFYDGIALFFGKLPVVYVEADLEELVGHYIIPIKLAKIWILCVRVMMILLLFWFLQRMYRLLVKI
jgi:hypothetical protein